MTWQVCPVARFDDLAVAWDQINQVAGGIPVLESTFVRAALDCLGDGREKIVWHGADGKPDCMFILRNEGALACETFQPSQMPLGAFVMEPGLNLPDLARDFLRSSPGYKLSLGLTQLDPVLVSRPSTGDTLRTLDYISTASVPLEGTFDAYWAARGKNLRQNMRKQHKQLEAGNIRARLEIVTSPDQVGAAIADYGRLESAGWKSGGGTAVNPNNAQGRFYQRMLEQFCSAGRGCIYRYWFDDRLAAMDLCVEGGGSLVILKTTYDESLPKSFSPALLMRHESFKLLFNQNSIKRIEFYGRVMDWHLRWTDQVRTLYHVNVYRSGFVSGAVDLVQRIKRRFKGG